ncbi:MAG: YlmC/YmxH family sporulation protein [Bacilli bacterium]|nr:YlmC/YmxH family sporulation protein [Bacilli bacterium]
MRLSDLQTKMVINVSDGKHLGVIADAEVTTDGTINYFTVMPRHFFRRLFKNETEFNILVKQIVKIGEDVILVEL